MNKKGLKKQQHQYVNQQCEPNKPQNLVFKISCMSTFELRQFTKVLGVSYYLSLLILVTSSHVIYQLHLVRDIHIFISSIKLRKYKSWYNVFMIEHYLLFQNWCRTYFDFHKKKQQQQIKQIKWKSPVKTRQYRENWHKTNSTNNT